MKCEAFPLNLLALILLLVMCFPCPTSAAPLPSTTDPAKADADFAIQGEYTGKVQGKDAEKTLAVHVIALGGGKFHGLGYVGGLPGDGWDGKEPEEIDSTTVDGASTFKGKHATGTIKDGAMTVANLDGKTIGQLKRVVRTSPTLGEKPPQGAQVLFDGKSTDGWVSARAKNIDAKMTPDGLLMQGANSRKLLAKHKLHIEFMLPYMPTARGQARGNSGAYLQGRYEVQMLDSFGLKGMDNECGGIYKIARPKVNMCYPPLSWQTYDIDFVPAEFAAHGKKLKNARITVRHNGVVIHENQELPHPTAAAPNTTDDAQPGYLHLQDHGNDVRYRNIWVVEE